MKKSYSIETFETADGAHLITSPRSLEACHRVGVAPDELLPVDDAKLVTNSDNEDSAALKREHFRRKRQKKLQLVREERAALVAALESQARDLQADGGMGPAGQQERLRQPDAAKVVSALEAQMAERERKRFLSIVKRQQKELDRLMANEKIKVLQQQKILAADAAEAKKKKEHEQLVAQREADRAAKRQAIELEKKVKAEKELERRRELARSEDAREKLIKQMEQEEAKRWRREAERREQERREKLQEHARKSQLALREQECRAQLSKARMQQKESKVRAMLEDKRRHLRMEMEEKQRKAEEKIRKASERQREAQEDKKRRFDAKRKLASDRASALAQLKTDRIKQFKEENDAKMATRREALRHCYLDQLDRKKTIVQRIKDGEKYKLEVGRQRHAHMHTLKTKHDLQLDDHLDNVQRMRRMKEFARLRLLQKIEDESERFEKIKEDRQFLIEQRKKMAHDAFLRKSRMKEAIERMRISNKIDKSLESLLHGGGTGSEDRKDADADPEEGLAAI
eukprot:scaffold1402_cov254-Pinguiococcus_pyrenoidosus.AAC.39